jgi:hypothetical protein
MALKGNLKDFSLTQLLNLIRLARKTGGLTIEESSGPLRIYCQDGRLTFVSRNGHRTPLAEMMLKSGRITEAQLHLLRPHLGVNTDKELALRLVDMGLVSQEDVTQAVRQQMLETLFPVFAWNKGTFSFDPDARPSDDDIAISVELESIILEGGRRIRETGRLQESIPSLDIVPRLSAGRDARMRNVNLTADQWKVISFINGRNSLKKIAEYTGLSEFLVRRTVHELLSAELVEMDLPGAQQKGRPGGGAPKAPRGTQPAVSKNIIMRIIDRVRRL